MMKHLTDKYRLATLVVCLLAVSLFGSCIRSLDEGEPSKELVFKLQLPSALEVHTRAGESELDGITITDVWVVQFNAANGVVLQCQNFSGSNIGATENNQTIKVTTSSFSQIASRFYIIANAGTDFLTTDWKGTEAELKALSKTISSPSYDLNMLTAEPLNYTAGSSGQVVLVAPLKRAYAQVSLKWKPAEAVKNLLSVTAVKVGNLPKGMALFARGGGNLNTPYPLVANISGTETAVSLGSSVPANTSCRFFMGENLRGMGTGTSFAEKNLVGKGPGENGKLDGCTYVVLNGEYKYSSTAVPISVNYTIYLGGNLMNDYNIQRGYLYDVTININGANSADVRVTITDGNVIVFDKVVEITNTVDF